MSFARLLEHYDDVADAPDAAILLKSFVLNLAVSGKLVARGEKDWSSEPIENCFSPQADGRIIHQGWSPQCESAASPSDEIWGVLKTTSVQDGLFLPEHNKRLPPSLAPRPKFEVQAGDILITCAGPRARCGVTCLVRDTRPRLMLSGKMYRFRVDQSRFDPAYIELYLRSGVAQGAIDKMKTGSSESGLNLTHDRFRRLVIQYGALEEQQRIVAKVEELMALCNRLTAKRAERESARDRLAQATLARLNAPNPERLEQFDSDAGFALNVLSALTSRPDQIKQIRQTILTLAVQGRLSPVGKAGASIELLSRLADDQRQLLKSRSLRASVAHSSPASADLPFEIPSAWSWTCLGKLISDGPRNGVSPKHSQDPKAAKAITLTATTSGKFDPQYFKRVEGCFPSTSEYWLRPGDLLFQRGNTPDLVGMAAYYAGEPERYIYPDLMIKVRLLEGVSIEFVHMCAISPYARTYLSSKANGAQATMPKINQETLLNLPIPLPPFDEQYRIVACVHESMDLCDQLERALTTSGLLRLRLFDALLGEALRGTTFVEAA